MSIVESMYASSEATIRYATAAVVTNGKQSPVARISKKIDFLLCNSCFWCASYLNMRDYADIECPSCKQNTIEWMPLCANDVYSFDHNRVTGVILEFLN
jgi:rubrerythrin